MSCYLTEHCIELCILPSINSNYLIRLILNIEHYRCKNQPRHTNTMILKILSTLLLVSFISITSHSQGTQLLRQPTLSDDSVVFIYANDLWKADRAGGEAVRLTLSLIHI